MRDWEGKKSRKEEKMNDERTCVEEESGRRGGVALFALVVIEIR